MTPQAAATSGRYEAGGALRGAPGLVAVSTVLTLVMALPVLRAAGTRLIGSEIVGRHADPFIVIQQLENPRGPGVFTQPATDYLGAVIAALTGDGVVAYNALVLLSFPLACLFAYLLALRLAGSKSVAWLTGLAYGFAPYHVAHSAYHPHGAQTQWLPLYLLALWLCLGRATAGRLGLLVLSTALVVLSNFYHGLIAATLTPVALLGFWLLRRSRGTPNTHRQLMVTTGTLVAIAASGLAYVARFAGPVLRNPTAFAFDRGELALYGARWWSYWLPPVEHPLFGGWSRTAWERHGLPDVLEQQLTLSWGFILLAGVALSAFVISIRQEGRGQTGGVDSVRLDIVPTLAALAGVAFVFSLTPTGILGSLRPSGLVYHVLPMFRAYARFGLVVFLATAFLAALGAAWLSRRSRSGKILAISLVVLAAIELAPFPPFRWRDVLPTAAHRWLDDRPGPIQVLDCVSLENRAEHPSYAKFRHEIKLRGGFGDCGDPQFGLGLAARGFTHLLVRRKSPLGDWLDKRPAPTGTVQVGDFEDALLYQVQDPAPSPIRLEFTSGFHWREYLGEETYRWMSGKGILGVVNPTSVTFEAIVELRLHSFPGPRGIEVEFGQVPVTRLEVTTEPTVYTLPTLAIPSGTHTLVLRSHEPPVVADTVLANGDVRELSIAVWDIRWEPKPTAGSRR
ncbi:MAG: hypothetical protein OES47_10275 [Acidobacteriota bacterium]|nr:hypothetical protein [Acidobacteriota bacterium]